jgi:hypothetical protein
VAAAAIYMASQVRPWALTIFLNLYNQVLIIMKWSENLFSIAS